MTWAFTDPSNRVVVNSSGTESCLVEAIADWIAAGNTPAPYVAPPVPIADVSPRQIRQALTKLNLRVIVETAVNAADQDTKDWYQFATYFDRANPHVTLMGTALGVTSAQLDQLWQLAATL